MSRSTNNRSDADTEQCEHCAPKPDAVNHPRGMIFVGWGLGWQWCRFCGGSGVKPAQVFEEDAHDW